MKICLASRSERNSAPISLRVKDESSTIRETARRDATG